MRNVFVVLAAVVVLFAATGETQATTVSFTGMGTYQTATLIKDGVTVTGSADINVQDILGLGIVGGTSDIVVNFGESITFSLGLSASDVEVGFIFAGGSGTANADIEAFDLGGTSLGTQTVDLFIMSLDVSALFSDQPLEKVTITPLNTNVNDTETYATVGSISYGVPEPAVPEPAGLGLIAISLLAVRKRRR